jgi:hypothetical protein
LHGLLRAPIEQVVGFVRAGYGKTMGDEAGGLDLGEHPPGDLPAASLCPASREAGGDGADLAADEAHATAVKGPAQAQVGGPAAIPRPDHDSAVEAGGTPFTRQHHPVRARQRHRKWMWCHKGGSSGHANLHPRNQRPQPQQKAGRGPCLPYQSFFLNLSFYCPYSIRVKFSFS